MARQVAFRPLTEGGIRNTRPEIFNLYPDQMQWIEREAKLAAKSTSQFLRDLIEKARAA